MSIPAHVDVLIVGGGPVGGALALSLVSSGLRIAVVEARQEPVADTRALALAHASRVALEPLGAWPTELATAIHTVHVSQQRGFGRVLLDRQDLHLPALGYVMPYAALARAIHGCLMRSSTIHYLRGMRVTRVDTVDAYAVAHLADDKGEQVVTAQLVVLAEGGQLLKTVGIEQRQRAYHQQAVLAEVVANQPHGHRAFERFADDGPIALLPLSDEQNPKQGRYAAVWTRPAEDTLDVANLPDAAFLAELQARVGERVGLFTAVGSRSVFPLTLRWANQHCSRRVAVVGNAAQTLHPVAGQGFNLGLRDALALARLIRATPPQQLGDAAMLKRFASLRQADSLATIGFTDGLIRLFAQERVPLKLLRSAGLVALGNNRPLRREFAQRMVFGTP